MADTSGSPTEVATLPAPQLAANRQDVPLVAGASGFLHQEQGLSGYTWTDYASGTDTPQPQLAAVPPNATNFLSAGGDHVAYQNGTTLGVGDPTVAGSWVGYDLSTLSALHVVSAVGANGTRALVQEAGGVAHLLQLNGDGTMTDVAMTGLPSSTDYTNSGTTWQSAGDYALIRSTPKTGVTGTTGYFLVRLDTGVATAVPAGIPLGGVTPSVHGDYLAWSSAGGVSLVPVADALAGTTVTPTLVPAPAGSGTLLDYDVIGQQVVMMTQASSNAPLVLSAVPIAGGPATQLDAAVTEPAPANRMPGYLPQGPGGALVVGGTGTGRAVQRLTAAADGSVSVTSVRQLPPPAETTATLTMAYGQVRQLVSVPQLNAATKLGLATTPLAADNPDPNPSGIDYTYAVHLGAESKATGYPSVQPGPCSVDATCVRETDGDNEGPIYETVSAGSAHVFTPYSYLNFPSADTTVVSADAQYAVIDSAGRQTLWQPDETSSTFGSIVLGPATGAALWQGTLWRADAPGQIQASLPQSGLTTAPVVQRTISTGAACTATEVQVTQRWLYWSCGSNGPAGVYDLTTDAKFGVDPGPVLLGDGYLVRHDAVSGELRLTDVHADSVGATSVLATFPQAAGASDDRDITWTVDRQSGEVAYADAGNAVHVLTTGVPASPVTVLAGPIGNDPDEPGRAWIFTFEASRPVSSWQLVIRRKATGQIVFTHTAGATPAGGQYVWDGQTDSGTEAYNGAYTWQILTTPADATGSAATPGASGAMTVSLGRMPFHSYNTFGASTLLAVAGSSGFMQYAPGTGMDYEGNGTGAFSGPDANSSWNLGTGASQVNAVVPFGDLDGDGYNDLIVRNGAGQLEYYPNAQQGNAFNSGTPKLLGGGWNIYTRLVSTGDLNGDGHDDLIARDASGELWFYPGTGSGGFGRRVPLGGGWNTYTRLVGVGDLNGDGNGDLLAVDTSGGLWRYLGNGHGGFGPRVKLGSGFQLYNAMVGVGDMTTSGHNSVVARDAGGVLWRYDSTAAGTLQSRVRIGGGWNAFAGLY